MSIFSLKHKSFMGDREYNEGSVPLISREGVATLRANTTRLVLVHITIFNFVLETTTLWLQ